MNRRLRWGGCVTWRQVAQTVVSETPTCAAIWLTDMPVQARSRICYFLAALIGRQAMLRMPRAVGVSLAVLGSVATSPAIRRLRKASRGSQLFELMLPRCTDLGSRRRWASAVLMRGGANAVCSFQPLSA